VADEPVFSCFSVGSIAGVYEEIYVPRIFIPWARLLLERAALRPGEAVLMSPPGQEPWRGSRRNGWARKVAWWEPISARR